MGWLKVPEIFHSWNASAYNAFGWVMEEVDNWGNYRHAIYDDNLRFVGWKSGPNPIAEKLRESGKEKNDLYETLEKRKHGCI